MLDQLSTVQEAMAALGVSRATIYRLIQNGEIDSLRVNGRGTKGARRIRSESINAYIARQSAAGNAA